MRITSSTKFIQLLAASVLIVGAGITATASAHDRDWDHDAYRNSWQQSGQWRPAPVYSREVVRNYNYVYYPAQQVYYSPTNGNWFWANRGNWQVGARLPGYLNVDLRLGGVPVVLGYDRPYVQHAYVEQTYGQPWRAEHDQRVYYGRGDARWDQYRDNRYRDYHEHRDDFRHDDEYRRHDR